MTLSSLAKQLVLSLLFFCPLAQSAENWKRSYGSVQELLGVLKQSKTARNLLKKATDRDPKIWEKIKMADASYTESVFARSYSLLDGGEEIKIRHKVHLKRDLEFADAVLDLAHELVHYNHKAVLDPYSADFTLENFVRNGIEGEGGELEAFRKECLVSWELEKKIANFPKHKLCLPYRKKGTFSLERARKDYYAIGGWKVQESVKKTLSEIHHSKIVFTSSYANKPYPVALVEEFYATKQAACTNNQKKYRLIASQTKAGRVLASIDTLEREKERLEKYNKRHCLQDVEATAAGK